jgi:hypothetical protein
MYRSVGTVTSADGGVSRKRDTDVMRGFKRAARRRGAPSGAGHQEGQGIVTARVPEKGRAFSAKNARPN